jgi:UDP-N-acetylglucosamine 2-epimerase
MPEEHNRIEVDRIASLLLCPDERSRQILRAEGVSGRAEVVGDVMADANFKLAPIARGRSPLLAALELEPGGYAVATVHRQANVRPGGWAGSSRTRTGPIFPTPARPLARPWSDPGRPMIQPSYLDFAALASQARVILTDSWRSPEGSVLVRRPCVTLRPSTE